jgi:surface antigen
MGAKRRQLTGRIALVGLALIIGSMLLRADVATAKTSCKKRGAKAHRVCKPKSPNQSTTQQPGSPMVSTPAQSQPAMNQVADQQTTNDLEAEPDVTDTEGYGGEPYIACQCTRFAWEHRPDLPGNLGNANTWNERAAAQGFPVDGNPRAGDIAVFEAYSHGALAYGHVAYVTGVNGDGTINIAEDNWVGPCHPDSRRVSAAGLSFIHHKGPPPLGPPVFGDVHVYSSNTLEVTAGDQVKAVVTALYHGPTPIPCGYANLGVIGDGSARFADLSSGFWPNSPWRWAGRVAAVGCIGDLDPGERAEWDLTFRPPEDTPSGTYLTANYAPVHEGRAWSTLQIPISLHVIGRYAAQFAGETGPSAALAPGETGTLQFTFRNTGVTTLHRDGDNPTRCRGSNPVDRNSTWIDPSGANVVLNGSGQPQGVKIDQEQVGPGETFTCTIPLRAPTQAGKFQEYFSPVTEGKAWLFNNGHDDVWFPLVSADANHVPFEASDYKAQWVTQSGPSEPMAPGQTGTLRFTFRNTGTATLYRDGTNPTHCRASHPRDRSSAWADPSAPTVVATPAGQLQGVQIDQEKVGPGELFTCTIPLRAPTQTGQYQEYFSPVTEGKAWMYNNGHDDVWFPLTSG